MAQAPPSNSQGDIDTRFQLLLTLLALAKDARHKAKKTELEFLIVNQSFNLARYRHCVYWEKVDNSVTIVAMSGLVHIDPGGPYAIWLKRVIENFLRARFPDDRPSAALQSQGKDSFASLAPVTLSACDPADRAEWAQWSAPHAMIAPMRDRHGAIFGGIWVDRDEVFSDLEIAVMEDMCDGYAHSLQRFLDTSDSGHRKAWKKYFALSRSNGLRLLAILTLIMLLPVRMSATAPVEVAAFKPEIVSVAYDASIASVEVVPGQVVKAGDVLAKLDSTVLANRAAIAQTEAAAADIALRKTERESLADPAKLAEIAVLRAQRQQKIAEQQFASEMLQKSDIRAPRDGVAIFSDVNSLVGRPVRTGEQIMLLADTRDTEFLIRVPVDAMIDIDQSVPARIMLHVSPFGSLRAQYQSIGYQATPDPDGLLTYKIHARADTPPQDLRIGWTGTAKVYGARTVLALNILRRPIITLRRKLGL